jgi:NAD(P)-dependent dehydrogenase (short-subunit alcohol dehydrogenase family)
LDDAHDTRQRVPGLRLNGSMSTASGITVLLQRGIPMSTGRLAGQVAWISGATSGIGEAAARLFAQEGAHVALVGRRVDLSQAIAEQINASGGQALAIACDVSREDHIRASIEETVAVFGGLQIVINNAGMVQVKLLHECTDADWDLVMGVNVKSMFLATKAP